MIAMYKRNLSCSLSTMKVYPKSLHLSLSSIPKSEERSLVGKSSSMVMSISSWSLEASTILTLDACLSLLCQSII